MKYFLLIIISISLMVLSGCSIKKDGCEKFKDSYKNDCNLCESQGGKYWIVDCSLPK